MDSACNEVGLLKLLKHYLLCLPKLNNKYSLYGDNMAWDRVACKLQTVYVILIM